MIQRIHHHFPQVAIYGKASSGGGSSLAIDGLGANNFAGGAGSVVLSGLTTTSSNDVIIVDICTTYATITSVTSSTLGALAFRSQSISGVNDIERWWIKAPSPLTGDSITITANAGGASVYGCAYAFSGSSNPTSPWDVASVTSTSDPISITPASSNTVVLAGFFTSSSSNSPGTGFTSLATMIATNPSFNNAITEYKAVTSPTATSCTLTLGAGTAVAAIADVLH